MSPKKSVSSTFTPGLVIASLALSLGAGTAAAAGRDRHGAIAAHRIHNAYIVHPRHHLARLYGYAGTASDAPGARYFAPGYATGNIYAPGRGILDEARNLPTSACPNDQRDVNQRASV
jgi:hypothetical protein